MNRPRLLLADDHKIVLEGLRNLLKEEFEIVGTVEDGRALVSAAKRLDPDVIVVDISMPLLNGIEAIEQLRKAGSRAKVIFLTMHSDMTYATRAFEVGASGYVLKHSAPSELITAIRQVLKGESFFPRQYSRER
ncbi:MAG: response regulator transcription factor, partial [Acidobacteriota bacterium]